MPKCSWLTSKGPRKGKVCDIYTTKKVGDNYFCASHFKMVNDKNDPVEDELKEIPVVKKKLKSISSNSKIKIEPISSPKTQPKPIVKEPDVIPENEESIDEDCNMEYHHLEDEDYCDKAIRHENSKSDFQKLKEKIDYLCDRINKLFPPFEQNQKIEQKSLMVDQKINEESIYDLCDDIDMDNIQFEPTPKYTIDDLNIPRLETFK